LRSGPQIGDHGNAQSPSARRKNFKVAEMMTTDRSAATSPQPSYLKTTQRRWLPITGRTVLILAVVIGSYTLGRHWRAQDIADYNSKIMTLQKDNDSLTKTSSDQRRQIDSLTSQLKSAQVQLDEIFRPTRKLEIKANESKRISVDQLIIGLIGTPRNENVDMNVNGRKYTAAAGNVTNVQLSTNCRIEVMSFDVLTSSAVINTTCTTVKP
jgi:hypothetical protein